MGISEVQNEISASAAEFSASLQKLAVAINADVSKVVRNSVLRVHRSVIKASPVDTGSYRASHGISNSEPSDKEGIVRVKKGKKGQSPLPPPNTNWTWKVGDGDIWLFNNLPYAERLEKGHSKQAPVGVYRKVIPELKNALNAEISKIPGLESGGGGE